jgi:hypothetical protein
MRKSPLVVLVGDTHFGGFTALCPAELKLDDEGVYHASPVQRQLLAWWDSFWGEVKRERQGRKLIVIHMGDMVDGNVHGRGQAIANENDQKRAAQELMMPVREQADKFFMLRGTEAHVGNSAEREKTLENLLEADACEWEMLLDIDGVLFDLSHHGTGSSRPWGTSAATTAWRVIADCHRSGVPAPRFVVRGHTHMIDDSGERVAGTRAFSTPAWQLRNAYGYKVNAQTRSDIGGVIVDGTDVRFIRYTAPLGRKVYKVTL